MLKTQTSLFRPARFLALVALISVGLMFLTELICLLVGALNEANFGFSLLAVGAAVISLGAASLLGSVSCAWDYCLRFQRIDKRKTYLDRNVQSTPDIRQSLNFAMLLGVSGLADASMGILILNFF